MKTRAFLTAVALLLAASVSAQADITNLVTNGSFEQGSYQATYGGYDFMRLWAGTPTASAIAGWTVANGSVDWIGGYWQAADGNKSVDMSGNVNDAGVLVSQNLNTVSGKQYLLQFAMTGNPDNLPAEPDKPLEVDVSLNAASYQFSYNDLDSSHSNMNWITESFLFTADTPDTVLTFKSGTASGYGAVIDNVSVLAVSNGPDVPAPAAVLLGLVGLSGLGLLMRKFA